MESMCMMKLNGKKRLEIRVNCFAREGKDNPLNVLEFISQTLVTIVWTTHVQPIQSIRITIEWE